MKCETITTVEQMRSACRLSACTRHSIVEVNVVIGVLLCGLLVGVRVVPIVVCDAVVLIQLHSHSSLPYPLFSCRVSVAIFLYLEV